MLTPNVRADYVYARPFQCYCYRIPSFTYTCECVLTFTARTCPQVSYDICLHCDRKTPQASIAGLSASLAEDGNAPMSPTQYGYQCGRLRFGSHRSLQHTVTIPVHVRDPCGFMSVRLECMNPPPTLHAASTPRLRQITHADNTDKPDVSPNTIWV